MEKIKKLEYLHTFFQSNRRRKHQFSRIIEEE